MKEVFIKSFDTDSLDQFWQEVQTTPIARDIIARDIDIYLHYESANLLAFAKPQQKLLVKFSADETCIRWTSIAEDEKNYTEDDFVKIVGDEINAVFDYLKSHQPAHFNNVRYLSNLFGDYTYVELHPRFINFI